MKGSAALSDRRSSYPREGEGKRDEDGHGRAATMGELGRRTSGDDIERLVDRLKEVKASTPRVAFESMW